LEEFLINVKVLNATLEYRIFESLKETVSHKESMQQIFFCKNGAGADSKGSPSTEGFYCVQRLAFNDK